MSKKSTLSILRENEREVRKKLIIDAAIHLFGQKSFKDIGMRDIANQAGISPASIYRYFKDRDELFVEAFIREGKNIILHLEKLLIEDDIDIEKAASVFVNYLVENDLFFQMMTYFMLDNGIKEEYLEKFNESVRSLLQVFDKMFLKIGTTSDVRINSHAFFAALNGIIITFRNYPGRSKEEVKVHMERLAKLIACLFQSQLKK